MTTSCGLDGYLELYRGHRPQILKHAVFQDPDGYRRSVYATWELSFAKLGDNAKQLLQLCAFFHYKAISLDIFQDAATNALSAITARQDSDSDSSVRSRSPRAPRSSTENRYTDSLPWPTPPQTRCLHSCIPSATQTIGGTHGHSQRPLENFTDSP